MQTRTLTRIGLSILIVGGATGAAWYLSPHTEEKGKENRSWRVRKNRELFGDDVFEAQVLDETGKWITVESSTDKDIAMNKAKEAAKKPNTLEYSETDTPKQIEYVERDSIVTLEMPFDVAPNRITPEFTRDGGDKTDHITAEPFTLGRFYNIKIGNAAEYGQTYRAKLNFAGGDGQNAATWIYTFKIADPME